jgi:hypothetical protein
MDYVHKAYKVEVMDDCLENQNFLISSTYQTLPLTLEMQIMPSPLYIIKIQAVLGFTKKPGRNQVCRFVLKGEFRGDGITSRISWPSVSNQCADEFHKSESTNFSFNKDESLNTLFESIVGPPIKKEGVYV